MEFDCPEIAATSVPGQFAMLGLGLDAAGTWLLPRPFSVGWTGPGGVAGFLVRTYGPGTQAFTRLAVGDKALILGPLGRPFQLESGREVECVARGVGLAPFIALAATEAAAGRRVRLIYGERDGDAVFDLALLRQLTDHEPEIYTEDGSVGTRGRVTAGLDPASDALLLGCGPTPMLRALVDFARAHDRDLQVSVEEHMGCGIGTCQGCVVKSSDGRWVKACIEGPVFSAADLDWTFNV